MLVDAFFSLSRKYEGEITKMCMEIPRIHSLPESDNSFQIVEKILS